MNANIELDRDWLATLKDAGFINNDNSILYNASEIAALIGVSKFETPYEYVMRKINKEKIPVSDYMRAGSAFEEHIINMVLKTRDMIPVEKSQWQQYRKKLIGNVYGFDIYVGGKPDAFAEQIMFDQETGNYISRRFVIEVKYMPTHHTSSFSDIPEWYKYQVYSYMYIFGLSVIFGALMSNGIYIVEKSAKNEIDNIRHFIDSIKEATVKLLNGSIINEKKETEKGNYEYITLSDTGTMIERKIKELSELYEEYKVTIENYKKFEKKKEEIVKAIKNISHPNVIYKYGDHEIIVQEASFTKIKKDELLRDMGEEFYKRYVEEVFYKKVIHKSRDNDEMLI